MKQSYTIPIVFLAFSLLSYLVAIISVAFFPTGAGYNIPVVSTLLTLVVSGLLGQLFLALGVLSLVLALIHQIAP